MLHVRYWLLATTPMSRTKQSKTLAGGRFQQVKTLQHPLTIQTEYTLTDDKQKTKQIFHLDGSQDIKGADSDKDFFSM